jgi:phosphoglycolate phosphatase
MPLLTVVFDLDGTLVDTAPDLTETLNVTLAREGLAPVPYDRARTMIGGGARRMIEAALTFQKCSFTATDVDPLFKNFIAYYAEHIADRSQPFPGSIEALDHLAKQGHILAVCTNKLEGLSHLLLDALGLSTRFAAICGQDTFGVQKPDPVILQKTIEQTGGSTARAIMVGDSATDVDTARAAGVPVVAVDFGYTDTPVTQLNPDRIISHYRDLPAAVYALAGREMG